MVKLIVSLLFLWQLVRWESFPLSLSLFLSLSLARSVPSVIIVVLPRARENRTKIYGTHAETVPRETRPRRRETHCFIHAPHTPDGSMFTWNRLHLGFCAAHHLSSFKFNIRTSRQLDNQYHFKYVYVYFVTERLVLTLPNNLKSSMK